MGGFFGAALHGDCVFDVFYGTDYHSHLGTRRAGLVTYDREEGFNRAIHNIESTNFRPKFEKDILSMKGNIGIGCISDYEPQPLMVRSHLGTYAITTVSRINNLEEIVDRIFRKGNAHFLEMSGGDINPTELVAAIINQKSSIVEGIRYAQELVDGSLTLLLMTSEGIYAARDCMGRTPVEIGRKVSEDLSGAVEHIPTFDRNGRPISRAAEAGASPDAALAASEAQAQCGYCVCFDSFSYLNLGYIPERELGPGEIDFITPDGIEVVAEPGRAMKVCSFLWIYYGFPAACYEGQNVEDVRYRCGAKLADRDRMRGGVYPDLIAGVPDSGVAHAIGYSNASHIPYCRPFVKYTPTWPRSFMPAMQSRRNLIAKMKLIPIHDLIRGRRLLLIDDSIVRGTQLRETTEYLYKSGAEEVHIRPACPPLVYGCRYLNFSRSNSEKELITRRMIERLEGTDQVGEELLAKYCDPDSEQYRAMLEEIRKELNFTSLHYHRLDDMLASVGIEPCRLCTYCWNGKE
ncbi:amidophosphoribosyltransferase [Lachnoclostridium sp. Marseille-P6806]|uniref:amidophosphoribosyltransferase n=1 Tax=Lachnoclostridium sp. Marseille-P6806 TaxID=2364793 RepID=UPI001F5F9921|nr:amidophosphoribosyltransferase [Lachnoclostridium sp. Marseille-P6806]